MNPLSLAGSGHSVRSCPRRALGALALLAACVAIPHAGRAAEPRADAGWIAPELCRQCNLLVGAGTTFRLIGWSNGFVVPLTVELDDSRWEAGAFRFTSAQLLDQPRLYSPGTRSANPYWGFTAMRRWRVARRRWGNLYLGFGANYRTETDLLIASRWNFAYLGAYRLELPRGTMLELAVRHWSNAWFRSPDRGQNMMTLSFGF